MSRDEQQELIFDALKATHMHAIGASGYGKSKFLEWLLRYRLRVRYGFALLDWHGTLYEEVLEYLAYLPAPPKTFILDLGQNELVTGFNPFTKTNNDLSVSVSRRIDATVKPWGAPNADETPQVSEVLRMLYHVAAETGETLPNVAALLLPQHKALREWAAREIKDPYMKERLADFASWSDTFLRNYTGSTARRLDRFLALASIRRMIGRKDGNLDIVKILNEGSVLIVNLAGAATSPEASKLVATLLLNEFFEAALARAGTKKRYVLVLDEFENYITSDLAAMLAEVRKGGLSLILSHQHMQQLAKDDSLVSSVQNNAQLKVIFGGSDFETASMFAKELFLPTINERQVEAQISNPTTVGHNIQKLVNYGRSATTTESASAGVLIAERENAETVTTSLTAGIASGEASSETDTHLLVPILEDRLHSEQARDFQTKVAIEAQRIKALQRRQVFIKVPDEPEGALFRVPWIQEYSVGKKNAPAFRRKAMIDAGALPPAEVDALMAKSRAEFLAKAVPTTEEPPAKPTAKKKSKFY